MLLKDRLGDLSLRPRRHRDRGRSILVGKQWVITARRELHRYDRPLPTRNLAGKVRQADIVVAASGKAEMIKAIGSNPGATVSDVGTTRVIRDGKKNCSAMSTSRQRPQVAGAITPSPWRR